MSRWQQSCSVGAMMKRSRTIVISLVAAALSLAWPVDGQIAGPPRARSVVLVHGAWADGSSWSAVIPILQAAGLHVTAVQNPLSSLADSVAATRRALALQDGPTVLVAHSWGGTVITEIGTDPKVSALVYVAARAPDADEDFVSLSGRFPTMPLRGGPGARWLHHHCRGRVPQVLREWGGDGEGESVVCRSGADGRFAV